MDLVWIWRGYRCCLGQGGVLVVKASMIIANRKQDIWTRCPQVIDGTDQVKVCLSEPDLKHMPGTSGHPKAGCHVDTL